MRYVSAERTIAAAGAAFACVEDETSSQQRRKSASEGDWLRRALWRALLVTGLIIA